MPQDEPNGTPVSAQKTYDADYVEGIRSQTANYREKHKTEKSRADKLAQRVSELENTATAYQALQENHSSTIKQVQGLQLSSVLRGELSSMGVTDAAQQDLVIRASMPDLKVKYDKETHIPTGEFSDVLQGVVGTLGLGKPAETESKETATKPEPTKPAPVTITPKGPVTYDQQMAAGHAALAKARGARST